MATLGHNIDPSLLVIKQIMNLIPQIHIHDVLIQDINDLLSQTNVSLHRTLRNENQCADFFMPLLQKAFATFLGMMQRELSFFVNSFSF
jgi:hypothetical protein